MEQGSEGGEVAMNITDGKDTMPVVQTRLQVCLEGGVAKRRSKREVQLATQAVHRRGIPFGTKVV